MAVIYRKYGKVVDITEFEKAPRRKVRLHHSASPFKIPSHWIRRKVPLHGLRRSDNTRRTRQICVRRVSAALEEYGIPLLATLTFRGDASDASFANDSLRDFQVRLRVAYPEAQSIFVPELSPRGRIHFHGLLFNVPLHLGDTRVGRRRLRDGGERKTRVLAKLWREGYVDAIKTDGSRRLAYYISKYISKYITKGSKQVMFNAMRLLRISHGFPKETVVRGELAEHLQREYAKRKPIKEWEGKSIFLGKITRKTYEL